ncbi:hypothetical protein [Thermoflavimicrobium dichotomicum]|uniref:Uncharacterized protein n=1 Tax=Thermoflavimicrobium dichotomicum TaxID=46223 RepID=A0A1I3UZW2_9BACL|nr:hypothetical protein [Thermoflavimicrobium dichotomicum]SFJ87427.1 hypothetical protein SAMN05421852_12913 [Thermoflavimicrobium dichotomicum]
MKLTKNLILKSYLYIIFLPCVFLAVLACFGYSLIDPFINLIIFDIFILTTFFVIVYPWLKKRFNQIIFSIVVVLFIILLFILAFVNFVIAMDIGYDKAFYFTSPNGEYTVFVTVVKHANGFDDDGGSIVNIYPVKFYFFKDFYNKKDEVISFYNGLYKPEVKWINEDILEINFHPGEPELDSIRFNFEP